MTGIGANQIQSSTELFLTVVSRKQHLLL